MNKPLIMCKERSLRVEMAKKGMNVKMLAAESKLSYAYISLVINGHKNIGAKSASAITNAMQCDFDDIFTIEADIPIGKEICN